MLMVAVLVVLLGLGAGTIQESPRDSYLEAYEESHGPTTKVDREYTEPFPYPPSQPGYQYRPPKYQHGPLVPQYGPPSAPAPQYGPPSAPAPQYGPPSAPAPQYGPPLAPVHNYGPPVPPLVPVYGPSVPYGMLGFLDKLKLKLDLFTIGKILLKIVLFKKFVSFVAILCLLLFIPHLKHKIDEGMPEGEGDDEDAGRSWGPKKYKAGDEFLNNVTQFVVGAIDDFSKNYTEEDQKCESVFCKTKKIAQRIDNKLSYKKLAEVYSSEIH